MTDSWYHDYCNCQTIGQNPDLTLFYECLLYHTVKNTAFPMDAFLEMSLHFFCFYCACCHLTDTADADFLLLSRSNLHSGLGLVERFDLLSPLCFYPHFCMHSLTYKGLWPLIAPLYTDRCGERGGSLVECRTPEREVGGSKPTTAVLCP